MKKTIISLSFVFFALPALVFANGEWYTDDYSFGSGSFYTDDYSYSNNSWYTDDYSYNNSYYTDDYSYNDNSWYTDDYSYNNNWYTDDYAYANNSWYTDDYSYKNNWYTDDYSYNDNSWYTDDYAYANNSWYTDDYSYTDYSAPTYSAYYPQDYAYNDDYYSAYQDYYSYDSGYNGYGYNNYGNGCNSDCVPIPPKCKKNCNPPKPPKDNLDVICIVSDRNVKKGDSVTFSAQVDGGGRPYTFQWSGDVSGSDRKITRQFTNVGTYQASVRVTDRNGRTDTANCGTIVVEKKPVQNDLDLICIVSDQNIEEGDSVTFTANATGGRGSLSYQWSGDVSGSSRSITERFYSEGNYQAFVRVTDQNGRTATADCDVEVEEEDEDEDDFDAICRVSDSSIEEGDIVRFTADVDGGNSPFDYDWSGDIDDENDQSFSVRFNSEGTYDIELEVTDDDGRTARDTCTVRVEEEDEDDDDDDDDRDINVTTDRSDFGNLASIGSVYLNQVPYTGPEDAAKGIAFGVGILAWSIAGALIIRKKMNKNSVSSRIEAFKNANRNNIV